MKEKKELTWQQVLQRRSNIAKPTTQQIQQWAIENTYYALANENFKTVNSFWTDANGNKRMLVKKLY